MRDGLRGRFVGMISTIFWLRLMSKAEVSSGPDLGN